MSPITTTSAAAPVAPTSVHLQELRVQRLAALKLRSSIEDFDGNEFAQADLAVTRIAGEIRNEILRIEKDVAQAKIAELKAITVAFVTNFEEATSKCVLIHADKKAGLDEKQAASEAMATAKEALLNKLFGGAKIANVSVPTDKVAGTRGSISAEIKLIAAQLFAEGKTGAEVRKEIVARGFNDGTMNAAVKILETELGLKA